MIKDDFNPGMMGETAPVSVGDAAARADNCLSKCMETGLLGVRFLTIEQFISAMRENGWTIQEPEVYIEQGSAKTCTVDAFRKSRVMKFLLHTFGNGDTVKVINCKEIDAEAKLAVTPTRIAAPVPPTPAPEGWRPKIRVGQ